MNHGRSWPLVGLLAATLLYIVQPAGADEPLYVKEYDTEIVLTDGRTIDRVVVRNTPVGDHVYEWAIHDPLSQSDERWKTKAVRFADGYSMETTGGGQWKYTISATSMDSLQHVLTIDTPGGSESIQGPDEPSDDPAFAALASAIEGDRHIVTEVIDAVAGQITLDPEATPACEQDCENIAPIFPGVDCNSPNGPSEQFLCCWQNAAIALCINQECYCPGQPPPWDVQCSNDAYIIYLSVVNACQNVYLNDD